MLRIAQSKCNKNIELAQIEFLMLEKAGCMFLYKIFGKHSAKKFEIGNHENSSKYLSQFSLQKRVGVLD